MYSCPKCFKELKTSSSYINHKKKCNLNLDLIYKMRYDYVHNGLTMSEIKKKYKISHVKTFNILTNYTRYNKSKLDNKNSKIRKQRINYLKKNNKWKLKYLTDKETLFYNEILKNNLDKNYLIIKDKLIDKFHIEFAFIKQKIALIVIEDYDDEVYMNYQKEKHFFLQKEGWNVFSNVKDIIELLNKDLEDEVGINIEKSQALIMFDKHSIERMLYNGLTKKIIEKLKRIKESRPSYEILKQEVSELGIKKVSKKYKVSGNTIRNWLKEYQDK